MTKKFITFLSTIFLFFLLLTIGVSISHASSENTFNLTISPSLLDITANPGDTLKEKFRIRNNSSQPIDLSITVDKLDPHSRNGEVVPVSPQKGDDSPSWVTFDNPTITAKPKEWTEVGFTITIPKTAAFGYYYALRIGPNTTNATNNVPATKLIGQIVLPVLLNVEAPNAHADLRLLSFTTSSFFNEYLPVTFQVKLSNTGNIHVRPAGNIFIKLDSTTNAILPVNQQAGILIPDATRTLTTSWTDGFLVQTPVMEDGNPKVDKNGKIVTQLSINWDKLTHFRIGKYTATALVVYDNGKQDIPMEATTTFWVFPYTFFAVLLCSLLVLFFLVRVILKWYVAREVKRRTGN